MERLPNLRITIMLIANHDETEYINHLKGPNVCSYFVFIKIYIGSY